MAWKSDYSVSVADNQGVGQTAAVQWPGGYCAIVAHATVFTSAVVQYQASDGTWVPISAFGSSGTLSANGVYVALVPPGLIRLNVTSATALHASAVRVSAD